MKKLNITSFLVLSIEWLKLYLLMFVSVFLSFLLQDYVDPLQTDWLLENYASLLSCRQLDERIDNQTLARRQLA